MVVVFAVLTAVVFAVVVRLLMNNKCLKSPAHFETWSYFESMNSVVVVVVLRSITDE